jgi:hypothetical protein
MEKYCDTNLNDYIKIKLTEEGSIIYKKHYAKYNCEAPKLDIDDEGYVRFQIHEFMNIFGERLFMGATLPCETNCKIQVKDEWHYVKDGDLPKEDDVYLIYTTKGVLLGHYEQGGADGETDFTGEPYSDFTEYPSEMLFTEDEIIAWKEIVLPKEIE